MNIEPCRRFKSADINYSRSSISEEIQKTFLIIEFNNLILINNGTFGKQFLIFVTFIHCECL